MYAKLVGFFTHQWINILDVFERTLMILSQHFAIVLHLVFFPNQFLSISWMWEFQKSKVIIPFTLVSYSTLLFQGAFFPPQILYNLTWVVSKCVCGCVHKYMWEMRVWSLGLTANSCNHVRLLQWLCCIVCISQYCWKALVCIALFSVFRTHWLRDYVPTVVWVNFLHNTVEFISKGYKCHFIHMTRRLLVQ